MRVTIDFMYVYLVAFKTKKATRRNTGEEYEKKVRVKIPYNVINCTISCDKPLVLGGVYMSDTGDRWVCITVDKTSHTSKLKNAIGTCEEFYAPTELFFLCQPVVGNPNKNL